MGDVAHHQPRRHHGKAEVICHWQPGFQLVENAWNNFRQVAFWNTNTFCHRQLGTIFQVFIVSSSSTLCMSGMFILVLPHKENKLHPIYRTIKSQDDFNKYQQHAKLWFAWKIVLLQYRKQRIHLDCVHPFRCDLLEKSYFCSIANNANSNFGNGVPLWFAWKIVLLQYRKQQIVDRINLDRVVICLKNRTFAVSQTTYLLYYS